MLIVKLKVEYTHFIDGTPRWTMQPGETPTLERDLAKQLVKDNKAEWVGDGCGCPGIDEATIMRHNLAAMRGIDDDGTGDAEETEENDAITKQDGAALVATKLSGKK